MVVVVFEGNIYRRLGVFRAVVARVKHLRRALPERWRVRTVMVQGYDAGLLRLLHGKPRVTPLPHTLTADGVDIEVRGFRHRLLDGFVQRVCRRQPPLYTRWLRHLGHELAATEGLCALSAHDRIAAVAAHEAARQASVPLYITWHGASIYTDPRRRGYLRQQTADLLSRATTNFFVSDGLRRLAVDLCPQLRGEVLPNGADNAFRPLSEPERQHVRAARGIADNTAKVVAFAGRFEAVKNVDLLPVHLCPTLLLAPWRRTVARACGTEAHRAVRHTAGVRARTGGTGADAHPVGLCRRVGATQPT